MRILTVYTRVTQRPESSSWSNKGPATELGTSDASWSTSMFKKHPNFHVPGLSSQVTYRLQTLPT